MEREYLGMYSEAGLEREDVQMRSLDVTHAHQTCLSIIQSLHAFPLRINLPLLNLNDHRVEHISS